MGLIVNAGETQNIQVVSGESFSVSTRGVATVRAVSGMGLTPGSVIGMVTKASATFGPYSDGVYSVSPLQENAIATNFVQYSAPMIVVSSAAPNNADGRPDGTIYVQTAP
jgi:hypothetical protein